MGEPPNSPPEINSEETFLCPICGERKPISEGSTGSFISAAVVDLIQTRHPNWTVNDLICLGCVGKYRVNYIQIVLETEKGELSKIEEEVIQSLREQEILSENINVKYAETLTRGQRAADAIARFGGSWTFILWFGGFLVAWIMINSIVLLWRPFDPFPFILLNLILSCLAAIQAPIIMMSQNRQEEKDRLRAEHDYRVNLKAELEIRHLNAKLDQLLTHQWRRLLDIQQIQMELMEQVARKTPSDRTE
ncbi:DUF1003 domain-containing protein [Candidatus Sumerlaeota bacterium]|nr:DUF1003 domain-containing protein [Candidatus Sumerlaeota bacterium]